MKAVSRLVALSCLAWASIASAGNNSWTLRGPEGGPVQALATHPTNANIAVISTSRGLMRSADSGDTWTVVKNDTLNVPLDIVFDPSLPSRVVATDGLIYLSEDTGQSFQIAQGPEADGNVYRIAFAPDGTLYATTHTGEAYKAAPALANWVHLTNAWPANSSIDAIVVDPVNSLIVYAGIESVGVYRSNNGGTSWTGPLTTGFTPTSFVVNQLAVDPANPTHVFAATSAGIFRSVNRGSNWTQVDITPCSSLDFKPGSSTQMIALSVLGTVMKSADNGVTWLGMGIELQSYGLPKVRYAAGSVTRLLYASTTGISISGDLPNTHSNRNTGISNAASVTRIVKPTEGMLYVATDADWGSLYRRINDNNYQYSGFYWALLQAITGPRQTTAMAVSASNYEVVFLVNRGSELIRTTNHGESWTSPHPQFTTGPASDYITDVQIAPDNPLVAYVTRTETGVWKTTNGGTSFTRLVNSPAYVSAIGINPLNTAVLYAAGGPGNGSGIYKSTNGGAAWTEQLAPSVSSGSIYNSFVFHPTDVNTVFALAFGGVRKTVNGGGAWAPMDFAPFGTNIPASALIIDPQFPSTMIALNSPNQPGFLRSVDSGATWVETVFDIPGRESLLYTGVVNLGTLVAGTSANGIVEYTVAPDLSVSMADLPDVLPLGTNYAIPVTVKNSGPHASSPAAMTIFKPAWLTPGTIPTCSTVSPQEMSCQVGVLQPGESAVVPLTFAVAGVVNGNQFSVYLYPHEIDPDTSNNRIDETITAAELVDLDMTVTALPATIDLDETTVVTAHFVNRGPSPATNARIDFFLPGITLENAAPSAGTCGNTGAFTCSFGTVPPGGTASVALRFRGNAVGTYPMTAMVFATGPDSDNASNTAQLDIVVRPVSDIAVSLAESADPVNLDAPLQYIATVRNNGPGGGATQLQMNITGTAVTGATASDGACTTTTSLVTCTVNPLPAGVTTVTVSLATTVPGIATATATATFAGTDSQPTNNVANIGTTIRRTADIGLTITDSADPVTMSEPWSYNVVVSNLGPNATSGVVSIPVTGASIATVTSTAGTCTTNASVASCDFASLASQSSATITVNAAPATAPGTATGTALATFQGFDPDVANNSASTETLIRRVGDLGVAIIVSADPANSGVAFTYTATMRNFGPNPGTVQLAVPITGAAVNTAEATAGGVCTTSASSVQCEFAQLPIDVSATVTITVTAVAGGTSSATATAAFAGTDLVPGNNTASASTHVLAPPPSSGGSGSGSSSGSSSSSSGGDGGSSSSSSGSSSSSSGGDGGGSSSSSSGGDGGSSSGTGSSSSSGGGSSSSSGGGSSSGSGSSGGGGGGGSLDWLALTLFGGLLLMRRRRLAGADQ